MVTNDSPRLRSIVSLSSYPSSNLGGLGGMLLGAGYAIIISTMVARPSTLALMFKS